MTTTTHTVTEAERAKYGCPDWCERWDHYADECGPGEPPYHYGPEFGDHVAAHAQGRISPTAVVGVDARDKTAVELRELAAHCIAAAKWLEARA